MVVLTDRPSLGTLPEISKSSCSPPPPRRTQRRRKRVRTSTRVAALFLLLTSIALVHILYRCSVTWSSGGVYDSEPPTTVMKHRRVIYYFQEDGSSLPNVTAVNVTSTTTRSGVNVTSTTRSVHVTSTTRSELSTPITTANKGISHPRVVFYGAKSFHTKSGRRIRSRFNALGFTSRKTKKTYARPSFSLPSNRTNCVPMRSWQTTSFPTCNTMHELFDENNAQFLGSGGWRITWKVNTSNIIEETVAFKTLKWKGQFFDAMTENRHRVDAVAAERLTSSQHVINVYGYCGQSVINEFADNGSLLQYLRKHSTAMEKLAMARDVALGVADLHQVDAASIIVHKDLKPANIVVLQNDDGRVQLKLNDFNDAEFLEWNNITNRHCKFRRRRWTPTYHSPEEVWEALLDEKVDVYALGAILFFLMTGGHHPYKREGISQTSKFKSVAKGIKAKLPKKVERSKDPAIIALKQAFFKCQEFYPSHRPTAREVANELNAVLESLSKESR